METINYIILTTGRSGSTLLCRLLNLNGIFKGDKDFYCETFHKERDKIDVRKEAPKDYFERILEQYKILYGHTEIRGLKIVALQFNNLVKSIKRVRGYDRFRPEDIPKNLPPNTKYILLKRKNIKKQSISYLKAIKGLGWQYKQAPFRKFMIYHPSEIDSIRKQLNHERRILRSFLKENNIEPLCITYEGLCANFEETIKDVFKFLKIPLPERINTETTYKKQYNELNEQLLQEYELYRKAKQVNKKCAVLRP